MNSKQYVQDFCPFRNNKTFLVIFMIFYDFCDFLVISVTFFEELGPRNGQHLLQ